jgi:hypothetical protein
MATSKILVVVPTYNCHKQVLELLKDIHSERLPNETCFWFIDNLSTDGTFEAISKFIREKECKKLQAYQARQNNNLGGTHKIGFNGGISQGFDYVAILHGDNQAKYSDLVSIIDRSRDDGGVKSYLGSRFTRKSKLIGYSIFRTIGNIVLNFIYSTFKFRKLTDLGSGLNLYRVRDLKQIKYQAFGDSLTFNYELLLAMVDLNLPFEYVPIQWRDVDQVSNARNLKIFTQGLKILFTNLTHRKTGKIYDNRIYEIDRSTNE